jgi:predicted AlkP superfamily phosphohydrolase/phosphomutase
VKDREAQGAVSAQDYDEVIDELASKLAAIPDPQGREIHTRVFKPRDVYRECRGIPPDLIVHFGDLYWRSVGSLGHGGIYTFENDIGPDDANHAQHGIFILCDPHRKIGRQVSGVHVMDIAPSVLDLFGLPVPADMQGKVIKLE